MVPFRTIDLRAPTWETPSGTGGSAGSVRDWRLARRTGLRIAQLKRRRRRSRIAEKLGLAVRQQRCG